MPKIKDEETDKQIHHGRREKLRASFLKYGLETFNQTQVIEFALGIAIPRIDTNPTAHRLMNRFGSLDGIIEAHPDKLQEVPGVGTQAAYFLSFLRQFVTYATKAKQTATHLRNHHEVVNYLAPVMQTYSTEEFTLLCLDKNGKILLQEQIHGNMNRVDINLRELVDIILRVKASGIIIAHNHIDGGTNPSECDIAFTRIIVNILAPLEINVIDHLIFGKGDQEKIFSFATALLPLFKKEQKSYANSRDWEDM